MLGGTSLFAEEQSAQGILHEANQYVGSMDKYGFDAVVFHDGVETVITNNISYRRCGSAYYRPYYQGSTVVYKVVNSPY